MSTDIEVVYNNPTKFNFKTKNLKFRLLSMNDLPVTQQMLLKGDVTKHVMHGGNSKEQFRQYFQPIIETQQKYYQQIQSKEDNNEDNNNNEDSEEVEEEKVHFNDIVFAVMAKLPYPDDDTNEIKPEPDDEGYYFIGNCGSCIPNPLCPDVVEIGYQYENHTWGKGYGSEAGKAVTQWTFEQMNTRRIEATCFASNIGSYKVMESIGMQREGELLKLVISMKITPGEKDMDLKLEKLSLNGLLNK
eukprot:TRINITY_DN3688_c2_g1_i1.p1 TRINITY_DN3688_c2_g1~~TRINITY_DN3688_c2_g1_i1.p1  ORF type:complete len:245 (-),score=64.95 TRINITY_DN3688_c2_g1_i1:189-923(-)